MKGITLNTCWLCFVLINSVPLNILCVWILFQNASNHSCFSCFFCFCFLIDETTKWSQQMETFALYLLCFQASLPLCFCCPKGFCKGYTTLSRKEINTQKPKLWLSLCLALFYSLNKSHINFVCHSTWHCFIYLTNHMCVEWDVFKNAVMLISSMLSSKHNHTRKVHPSHHWMFLFFLLSHSCLVHQETPRKPQHQSQHLWQTAQIKSQQSCLWQ